MVPCSRFITIALGREGPAPDSGPPALEILDAMTLVKLSALEFPTDHPYCYKNYLVFSLDGHLLAWFGEDWGYNVRISTWDVQTGVLVSSISIESWRDLHSSLITYSTYRTMFVVLYCGYKNSTSTSTMLSLVHTCIPIQLEEKPQKIFGLMVDAFNLLT